MADGEGRPGHAPTRVTRGCKCSGPCFYCERTIIGPHEHDHFPLSFRHGGDTTVASCKDCHDAKDRVPLERWTIDALVQVVAGLSTPEARIFMAKVLNQVHDYRERYIELKESREAA